MPFTDTTAENLSTMERKVKFTEFGLGEMPNNFDINPFCKFLSVSPKIISHSFVFCSEIRF